MKYAALLRGINVGGNTMVKMEKLRETFGSLGFENVKSYINSGNLVFETRKTDDAKLAKKIREAIRKDFEMDIPVMVRSIAEIEEVIRNNPFDGKFENDKDVHVFFLTEPLSKEHAEKLLEAITSDAESIEIRGRDIYYFLRISIVDSVLGKGFIDKKLKMPATARNWRTVKKIAEM
jgi:uncharacterized protein (DUF1697 family)